MALKRSGVRLPLSPPSKRPPFYKVVFFIPKIQLNPAKRKRTAVCAAALFFGYMQPALSGLGVELCHGSLAAELDAATLVDIEALDHHLVANLADGVNTRHTLVAEL